MAPDPVFDIEAATGNGDVDVRMLIELASVGVQGAGGAAEDVVEQRPVAIEERPPQVRHGEGDMLPVAVGQDVLLFGNPLLGTFETATAAGLGLAGLAEEAGMGTVG